MSKKPAAKAKTVAKHPHHAKPAPAHTAAGGGAGGRHKAAASKKHVHHHLKKHHGTAKKRGLPLGETVACCAAEALAASARLAGWPVAPADVLALYQLTADSPDAGASILATLDAAYVFGLAGVRPVSFEAISLDQLDLAPRQADGQSAQTAQPWPGDLDRLVFKQRPHQGLQDSPLILGLDLPGPHTVLAEYGYWWSWGELYDPAAFPDAIIEEAWAVTWP